jgi:thymidylate kinase
MNPGKLIVFEGPDGVGKTTLATGLAERLSAAGIKCNYFSFPGREGGTLGRLVYDVHHDPNKFGIAGLEPTSLQMLHIAAHVDAIERSIRPLIRSGNHVILDRYWWSTIAYGAVGGSNQESIERMVSAERIHWGTIVPSVVFLLERTKTEIDNPTHSRLSTSYRTIATREAESHPVHIISTDRTIVETITIVDPIVQAQVANS